MVNGRTQQSQSVKVDYETYNELKELNKKTYIPIGKIIKLALEEFKGGKNNESIKERNTKVKGEKKNGRKQINK